MLRTSFPGESAQVGEGIDPGPVTIAPSGLPSVAPHEFITPEVETCIGIRDIRADHPSEHVRLAATRRTRACPSQPLEIHERFASVAPGNRKLIPDPLDHRDLVRCIHHQATRIAERVREAKPVFIDRVEFVRQPVEMSECIAPGLREQKLIAKFMAIPDPQDRLSAIISRRPGIPVLDQSECHDDLLVPGCASRVWLAGEGNSGICRLGIRAESPLVFGLASLLCEVFDTAPIVLCSGFSPRILDELGIARNLSPTRRAGLESVVRTIHLRCAIP